MNLYERLLKITGEIGKIEKTGRNNQQSYNFIEQAKIVAELRPQLEKHGVMILPETIERKIDTFTNAKGTTFIHANVRSRFTLINIEDPNDKIVLEWDGGEALDTSDKATNKAITASQKYFYMKLFNISDQEDADQESHQAPEVKRTSVGTSINNNLISEKQVKWLYAWAAKNGAADFPEETINLRSGKDDFRQMTVGEASDLIGELIEEAKQ